MTPADGPDGRDGGERDAADGPDGRDGGEGDAAEGPDGRDGDEGDAAEGPDGRDGGEGDAAEGPDGRDGGEGDAADGPDGRDGGEGETADGGAVVAPTTDGPSEVDPPRPGRIELLQDRVRALVAAERIGQFVSVGVAGATLETVIVALLTSGVFAVTAPPLAAKAVGAEASITLMFLLNDRWTFADEGQAGLAPLLRRYGTSHVVRLGGLTVAFATLFVLTALTDVTLVVHGANLWPTVANAIAIGTGMTVNYVAESLVTWRVHGGG